MHLGDAKKHAMGSSRSSARICASRSVRAGRRNMKKRPSSGSAFGDGTTNIGAFHEALSMAAVSKLPVVFVCENNQYMEYTAIRDVTPVDTAADRAASYGLAPQVVDGNDADACYARGAGSLCNRAPGRGPVTHRGSDVSPRRSLARGSGNLSSKGRGRGVARARSGGDVSQTARRCRYRRRGPRANRGKGAG